MSGWLALLARSRRNCGHAITAVLVPICSGGQRPGAVSDSRSAAANAAVHSTNVLARSDLSQDVSRLAAHARKNGELDASADPDLIGMLAVSAYLTVLIEWISDDPAPFALSEKVADTIDLLLDGVAPAGPTGPGTETPER